MAEPRITLAAGSPERDVALDGVPAEESRPAEMWWIGQFDGDG